MVQVYHMKKYNGTDDVWEFPPSKRTADDIAALGGVLIPETAEEVDPKDLDDHGRYFPRGVAMQVDLPVMEDKKVKRPK